MQLPPPLLADWLESLLPLLFVIFFVVRQFLESLAASKKEPEPAELEPIELPEAELSDEPIDAVLKPRQARAEREQGVDEFLRRLEEQREPAKPPAERKPQPSPPQEQPAKPTRRLVAESSEPRPLTSSSDRTSTKRPNARDTAAKPSVVESRDEQIAERLHEKFDHRLGRLASETAPVADDASAGVEAARAAGEPPSDAESAAGEATTASTLAAMLATPQGMRNAILANEILRPPTERW
ncbi:MAG: hypothetical protein AAGJ46_16715 [Planctomycetota bacterium]